MEVNANKSTHFLPLKKIPSTFMQLAKKRERERHKFQHRERKKERKTKTKNKCNLNLWWNPHSQGNKTITDKKTANRMPKEQ